MRSRLHRQKGVALIIVVLVVALVAVVATEMGARLQLQVQRAINIRDSNQAYWYAVGAEQFAIKSIRQIIEPGEPVHLNQPWAQADLQFPLEGGGIQATITDMQACFNVNALQVASTNNNGQNTELEARRDAFFRLIQGIDAEVPSLEAETLRDSLVDWLDADNDIHGSFGAEDSEYQSRRAPYLAANNLMSHRSELRLVNGVSPEWINALIPFVCAIPQNNELKININTITDENAVILQAVLNLPNLSDAQSLLSSRPRDGYDQIQDFFQEPEVTTLSLSDEQQAWFDITTEYFILDTKTRYNDAIFSMSSVIQIDNDRISVLRREFGGSK
jgi:general secretion pathway protein K